MEQNFITDIFLPLALAIIMLGMGLGLVPNDFKRVIRYPKAVTIGLINQVILLPLIAYLLLSMFSLKPELAVGVMLLSACPGGPTSNLISHLAKGDVALSVTLTAVTTFVTMFSIPLIVNFSIVHFMPSGEAVTLPIGGTILKLTTIAVVPVILGMMIKKFAPTLSRKADKPVRIMSAVFLVLIIAGAILKERSNVMEYFALAGPVTLLLNILTLATGFLSAKLFKVNHRQSITVTVESGIQNGTLAIAIGASMLKNVPMTIPPAIYSLIMFFTAGIVIALALRNKEIVKPATT
ncbi:bile acid:sodium symporter family protein [Cytophagaceae bacterium ABcell3]|nr:bile acid:sodium symporter family protein [Cytophagaceae bacterium ABcell3]